MQPFAQELHVRGAAIVASRFCEDVRFRIYTRIAYDRTGRIAQLVEACPGAAVFALALEERGGAFEPAAEALWDGVVAGARLDRVLAGVLAGWFDTAQRLEGHDWGQLVEASPASRARLLQEQRWLVRHASPRVGLRELLLPPPLAFAPEDVPREPAANTVWFRVMKAGALIEPRRHLEAQRALSRWASRQAVALHEHLYGEHGRAARQAEGGVGDEPELLPAQTLGDVLDYLRVTGRRPPPTVPVSELFDESARWHAEGGDREALGEPSDPFGIGRYDPSHPLPDAPFRPFRYRRIEVDPLTTVGALAAEGARMHHCVASYVRDVLEGGLWIASAVVDGVRLTVAVERLCGGKLRIQQARGVCNASLTERQQSALAFWLAAADSGVHPVDEAAPIAPTPSEPGNPQ